MLYIARFGELSVSLLGKSLRGMLCASVGNALRVRGERFARPWGTLCASVGNALRVSGERFALPWEKLCASEGNALCVRGERFVLPWGTLCASVGNALRFRGERFVLPWGGNAMRFRGERSARPWGTLCASVGNALCFHGECYLQELCLGSGIPAVLHMAYCVWCAGRGVRRLVSWAWIIVCERKLLWDYGGPGIRDGSVGGDSGRAGTQLLNIDVTPKYTHVKKAPKTAPMSPLFT